MPRTAALWVGHRGLPAKYPENTLVSLVAACQEGAAGVEFDVQLSSDNVPVLMHDENLARTTGLHKNVFELSAAQLQVVAAGEVERLGNAYAEEPIPLLRDVALALSAWPEVTVFVELKSEPLARVNAEYYVDAVWQAIAPMQMQCVIISYDLGILRAAQKLCPCPVGWVLTYYNDTEYQKIATEPVDYVICNYKKLPPLPAQIWQGPWQWFVYDVLDKITMGQCLERGIQWLETWDLHLAHTFQNNE